MNRNENRSGVNLRDALALHEHIRHLHWTTPVKDKGGNVIGMQHHHFLHERGLTTGIYSTSKTAREDFAQLLNTYYPELQGSLVSFGARRGFDIKTTISEEERKAREAAAKAEELSERPKGKKLRRSKKYGETLEADAA
jgi:hypothetical protein